MTAHVPVSSFWARFDADLSAIADRSAQTFATAHTELSARAIRQFIERPYLVRLIVCGAERLTLSQLFISLERRAQTPKVRELLAAVREPEFAEAWKAYRERMG